MKTALLIHGISNQADDWDVPSKRYLNQYINTISFRWDDLLNSTYETPYFQIVNDVSKVVSFVAPKWKIADSIMRWVLDRGGDLLTYNKVQEKAFDRLDSYVSSVQGEVILIAHSLGSVLAYEYIIKRRPSKVIKLITLGSPLDRNPVKKRVLSRVKSQTTLPIWWLNVWGDVDPVVCWIPNIKDNGAMQTFLPSEQRRIHAKHDLLKYIESLKGADLGAYS